VDIDPKDLASAMIGDPNARGLAKFCTRHKQCSRGLTCELAHSHKRGVSVKTGDFFQGKSPDLGDCGNWYPRQELNSQLDVPRRAPGSGSRHNAHAPDRTRAREALGFRDVPDLTKGVGDLTSAFSPKVQGKLILPPHLQQPPDLKTKRHVKRGKNIKDDSED
jgi:hypothetical protein